MLRIDKYPTDIENPKVGDIRLRIHPNRQPYKQIYSECSICHKPRWAVMVRGTTASNRCNDCAKVDRYNIKRNNKIRNKQLENWNNPLIREKHLAVYDNPIIKDSIVKPLRTWRDDPTNTLAVNNSIKQSLNKPEVKEKHSKSMLKYYEDPQAIEKTRQANIERYKDPIERKKTGEIAKKRWADPEYKDRVVGAILKGMNKKPNKDETKLTEVLNEYFPNEWDYIGDGKLRINGKNPDFKHKYLPYIIESFGDHWHNPNENKSLKQHQTEKGRIEFLANLGYKTLILWEKEIKGSPKSILANKIKDFFSNSKVAC